MSEHLRIVLLGKTGSGKSSLANTIFGEMVFEIGHTANSGTSQCKEITRELDGTSVSIIDTPGFFDNRASEEGLKDEIAKCVVDCSDGAHAFLILLKKERYTEHEIEVIAQIETHLSEEAFRYAVLVFTHGNDLPEGMQIEEFCRDNNHLLELLGKCSGRCHVFDNKHWNNNPEDEYRNNQLQREKLLNTIKEMMANNDRGCYTNEMLQEVKSLIQQEQERIRSSSGDMSQEEIREEAKKTVYNALKKAAGITTGVLLGALLGVPMMIAKVVKILKTLKIELKLTVSTGLLGITTLPTTLPSTSGVVLGTTALLATTAGAIDGGCIGCREADKADSIMETVRNTAQALGKRALEETVTLINTETEKDEHVHKTHEMQ